MRASHIYEPVDNDALYYEIPQLFTPHSPRLHAPGSGSGSKLSASPLQDDGASKRKWWNVLQFNGWRVGVAWGMIATVLVLLTNIVWTIWAVTTHQLQNGGVTILDGSCEQTRLTALWLHLAVNILGTMILGASNYCMQCLVSPTRGEIDRAHSKRKWLDIGIPSVRNVLGIRKARCVLWVVLALSGIPLHLLYNSVIFSTLSANDYIVMAVSEDMVTDPEMDLRKEIDDAITLSASQRNGTVSAWLDNLAEFRSWERLEKSACIRAYAHDYVADRSHVILVNSTLSSNPPALFIGYGGDLWETQPLPPYRWMCRHYRDTEGPSGHFCDVQKLRQYESTWTVEAISPAPPVRVDYCLSRPTEEHCTVRMNVNIMIIVIVANALKVGAMLLTLWTQRQDPLVTVGDAIKSFLKINDPATTNRCLASKNDFLRSHWLIEPKTWHRRRPYWFQSASKMRWIICNALCVLTLVVAAILLKISFTNPNLSTKSLSHIWSLGFGAISAEALVNAFDMTLDQTILTANAPQLILSLLFLSYNSLYTCMLSTQEWFEYAYRRKSLRVTDRIGAQRSTYRLQLPYRYGVPLLGISTVLHWLVSQSLFLVVVQFYDDDGAEGSASAQLGYSGSAIMVTLAVGLFTIVAGILMGCRRYRGGMPLVGSCSAAISAACHQSEVDAAELSLMWGVVEGEGAIVREDGKIRAREGEDGQEQGQGGGQVVLHCCFSNLPVSRPEEGRMYAGSAWQ